MAHESNEPQVYQEDLILKELVQDAIASKVTPKLDTLYLHEDMLAPYAAQFQEAMQKEVNGHTRKGHCRVTGQSDVPCHSKVLLVLWMKD
jgi:aromatic ring-opening dioxygenase catalytic subunit (LigB family)